MHYHRISERDRGKPRKTLEQPFFELRFEPGACRIFLIATVTSTKENWLHY